MERKERNKRKGMSETMDDVTYRALISAFSAMVVGLGGAAVGWLVCDWRWENEHD